MGTVTNVDSAIALTNTVGRGNQAVEAISSMVSFARPADANAYSINDVISNSTSVAAALLFPDCGRGGLILSASVVVAETDTTDFDLLLFDSEPTNHLDNAALTLGAGDLPKLLGAFRFLQGAGARINVGTNMELFGPVSAGTDHAVPPIAFTTTPDATTGKGNLYGLLVARSTWTPISACKFTIRLSIQRNTG